MSDRRLGEPTALAFGHYCTGAEIRPVARYGPWLAPRARSLSFEERYYCETNRRPVA